MERERLSDEADLQKRVINATRELTEKDQTVRVCVRACV
jgi:hypothetical protein